MTAKSMNGAKVCMAPLTTTTATITPTAIAVAAAVGTGRPGVTVTTATPAAVGDLVTFPSTIGFGSLAGKTFAVTASTAADFTIGNVVLGTGTMAAAQVITHYTDAELVCLCLSSLSRSTETSSPIQVATFCDPQASIPGPPPAAGSFAIGGYTDVKATDWLALDAAADDGKERTFRIVLPDNGYLIFKGVVNSWAQTFEIGAAQAWTAQITLSGKPVHVF